MDHPPPEHQPPKTEVAPPGLNAAMLSINMVLPGILTVLAASALGIAGPQGDRYFNFAIFLVGVTTTVCWIFFASSIAGRFSGIGRILLILSFPIIQALLIAAAFFLGCVIAYNTPAH